MGAHKLIIGCNFDQYKTQGGSFTPNRYLLLDKVNEKRSESSSTLLSQPMQSGDVVTEHMYRNPDTYTVTGTFALNGLNWNDNSYDFIQKGDRLTNIQNVFKKIKDEGLLCTLVTLDESNIPGYGLSTRDELNINKLNSIAEGIESGLRFETHKNMALNNISWVEKENSIDFNFGFQQILFVDTQEYENLDEAERINLGLPNVNSPTSSNLGTVLSNQNMLEKTIIETLARNGYIESDFWEGCVNELITQGMTILGGLVLSIAAAVAGLVITVALASVATTLGIVSSVAAGCSAIFPVGTIIAAAVVFTAAVAAGITYWFTRRKREKKKRMAYKLINGSAKQDTERLVDLLTDVKLEVNKVTTDVVVYEIREDVEQQVILSIAGTYYVINFTKNNTNKYGWSGQVRFLDGTTPSTIYKDKWCPVSRLIDMNRNQNVWFRDETGQYEVYLMNPAFDPEYNPKEEDIETVRKKLTSYTIWVSFGDIQKHVDKINKAIEKSLTSRDYEI